MPCSAGGRGTRTGPGPIGVPPTAPPRTPPTVPDDPSVASDPDRRLAPDRRAGGTPADSLPRPARRGPLRTGDPPGAPPRPGRVAGPGLRLPGPLARHPDHHAPGAALALWLVARVT